MADDRKITGEVERSYVTRGLSLVEDVVYVGLGVILAASAVALLIAAFKTFIVALIGHKLGTEFVGLLDEVLLVLLVIELLYTVQVSFREHGLKAEPFVVVALIATIRRILVVTAESAHLPEGPPQMFKNAMVELVVLIVMVLVLVGSLIALQRHMKEKVIT
jgi:uncharacterized membrane protein (DUF373 family)